MGWLVQGLAAAVVGMIPLGAQAVEMDGNRLLEACKATEGAYDGFCLGFLTGVIDGMQLGGTAVATVLHEGDMDDAQYQAIMAEALPYCLPPDASIGVIRGDLVSHLEANAGLLVEDMQTVLIKALADLYPCQQ